MNTSSPPPAGGTPADSDWNIDVVVEDLRALREQSLVARQRLGRPGKLPARKTLASVVDRLSAALFPNRLGTRELSGASIDYFVGQLLDATLSDLREEILRELQFCDTGERESDQRPRATALVRAFAAQLPAIRALLDSDIQAACVGDPAAHGVDEVLACYPGITAVIHHRLAHALYTLGAPLVARIIAEIAHASTGIDIHPGARIAGSFFIDHGTGVVIGETAIIGERVRLYQAVTLGAKSQSAGGAGVSLRGTPRHPIVEDDVVIYSGATILGRVTIGAGSVIGGNVWLTRSVPPGSNISQAKVREDEHAEGSGI